MSGRFTHKVLPYGDVEAFVAGAVPFLREGVEAGDTVLAVLPGRNLQVLRERLGSMAEAVEFVDAAGWFRHPVRTLAACLAHAEALAGGGRRLRLLGEPVWDARSPLEVTEWQRIEGIVNIAFAETGAALLCPYDVRRLPAGIVAGARRSHPETVRGTQTIGNPCYMDPRAYTSLFDQTPLPPPPATAETMMVQVPDLYWLRVYVADYARRAAMPEETLQRLLVAVTEVVTNALRHGEPPITLRLWTEPGELICEVCDRGRWRPAADYGFVPPDPAARGRCGLWAVRLLCSVVQLRAGDEGTTVRLRLSTGVPAGRLG